MKSKFILLFISKNDEFQERAMKDIHRFAKTLGIKSLYKIVSNVNPVKDYDVAFNVSLEGDRDTIIQFISTYIKSIEDKNCTLLMHVSDETANDFTTDINTPNTITLQADDLADTLYSALDAAKHFNVVNTKFYRAFMIIHENSPRVIVIQYLTIIS